MVNLRLFTDEEEVAKKEEKFYADIYEMEVKRLQWSNQQPTGYNNQIKLIEIYYINLLLQLTLIEQEKIIVDLDIRL